MTTKLWLGDLPYCTPCGDGDHDACPDLIHIPGYDLLACGCDHPSHEGTTE